MTLDPENLQGTKVLIIKHPGGEGRIGEHIDAVHGELSQLLRHRGATVATLDALTEEQDTRGYAFAFVLSPEISGEIL